MKLRYVSIFPFITLLCSPFCSYAGGEPVDVQNAYHYFQKENYTFFANAPYLSFSKNKIEVVAFPTAKEFKEDGKILDVKKNSREPLDQINFSVNICNHSPATDFNADLLPILGEQKRLMQKELKETTEYFFKEEVPEIFFQSLENGKKYQGVSFVIKYEEEPSYCDAKGGRSVVFKLFIGSH